MAKGYMFRELSYFEEKYRRTDRGERAKEYEDFLEGLAEEAKNHDQGIAAEFPLPGNVGLETVRTNLYASAKALGIKIHATTNNVTKNTILVGIRNDEQTRQSDEDAA